MTNPSVKRRVLVIDDEVGLLRMVKLALEQTGRFEVVTESHAEKALETAQEFRPELVLLDVMMPGMDGGAVAASLRGNPVTKEVRIIFLTAAVQDDEVKKRGGIIGGDQFLAKPVSAKELIGAIEQSPPSST